MKILNLFGLLLGITFSLVACSDDEINGDAEMGGNSGSENTQTSIKPPMEGEGLNLVGSWYGYGPYVASGGNASAYGLVNGIWEFYNDSTYSWIGSNSFGYKYSEKGKWHYSVKNETLTTDSPCGINWKVEEVLESQWVGTLLGAKKGTYTYTRNNIDILPSNIRIVDYKEGGFILKDTLVNYQFNTKEIKCGVCYGTKNNKDISTFKRLYANKIYTDTIYTIYGVQYKKVYNVEINLLEENERYQLCSFIEYNDGNIVYGKIYNAICITPPQNTIYLGEVPDKNKKVYFWATKFMAKNETSTDFTYSEASEYLSQLGKNWRIPSGTNITGVLDKYINYSNEIQILTDEAGRLDYIQSKSKINGNKLCLKLFGPLPVFAGSGSSYMRTDDIWISDIKNTQHCSAILYNSERNSAFQAGDIGFYHRRRDTDCTAKILPMYEVTVAW